MADSEKEWDLEAIAWKAVYDALPPSCRTCRWASRITFYEYEDIVTMQKGIKRSIEQLGKIVSEQCQFSAGHSPEFCGFSPEPY